MTSEVFPIVRAGAPVLRAPAKDVPLETVSSASFQELIARMVATMRAAPGVGLAAPQIGVSSRLIVLEDRTEYLERLSAQEIAERERVPFSTKVFVNPMVIPISRDRVTFFEGCLSVPGYVALVERFLEVEVCGWDEQAQPQRWRVKGWPARILQHEVDHIDGHLYVDRMLTRSFAHLEQARADLEGRPIAEVKRLLGIESERRS
jgi:peptide deformylase